MWKGEKKNLKKTPKMYLILFLIKNFFFLSWTLRLKYAMFLLCVVFYADRTIHFRHITWPFLNSSTTKKWPFRNLKPEYTEFFILDDFAMSQKFVLDSFLTVRPCSWYICLFSITYNIILIQLKYRSLTEQECTSSSAIHHHLNKLYNEEKMVSILAMYMYNIKMLDLN